MKRLPKPERDAVRSYVSRAGAEFVVSLRTPLRKSKPGAWTLLHQPSGARAALWTYRECIDIIRRLRSRPESESERWVILPRDEEYGGGQVLFDRGSGVWYPRGADKPVRKVELEIMSAIRPLESFQLPLACGEAAAEGAEQNKRRSRG